jgi:hypothetical protein
VFDIRRLWRRGPAAPPAPSPPDLPAWINDETERAAYTELVAFCQDQGIGQYRICTRGAELPPSRELEVLRQMIAVIRTAESEQAPDMI